MTIPNRVIIWSSDNYNSLAMLRQVAQGGLKIDFLLLGKPSCTARSKYIQKIIQTSSIKEGYRYLMENYRVEQAKPIILTSGDNIIAYIDDHRSEMTQYFIVPGTTKGVVRKYNDKYEQTCLAESLGIVVPKSEFVKWDSSIDSVPFPCMIKPSHQKAGMKNEFKFKVCKDRNALAKTLKYVDHDSVFIAQQLVAKEKDLLVYGARMWDGNVVLAGSLETDRFAVGQGSSYGKVLSTIPDCIDTNAIKSFLERIDYYGVFSFEYGLMDGKAYFFEVNLRNDGTSSFFFQSGANIPLAYVYSCAGIDYSTVSTHVTSENYYMDEIYDYVNVIQHKVKKTEWQKQRREVTAFKFYDSADIRPFITMGGGKKRKELYFNLIIARYRMYIVWIFNKLGIKL